MTSDEGLKPEGAPERSPKAGVGARREWHDVLAEGVSCGLHRIERPMRAQASRPPASPTARHG